MERISLASIANRSNLLFRAHPHVVDLFFRQVVNVGDLENLAFSGGSKKSPSSWSDDFEFCRVDQEFPSSDSDIIRRLDPDRGKSLIEFANVKLPRRLGRPDLSLVVTSMSRPRMSSVGGGRQRDGIAGA
jgi:hypothetical protein